MGLAFALMMIFTFIALLKGNGSNSPIGVERCDELDWTLSAVLIVISSIFEIIAMIIVRQEYKKKIAANYNFIPGEFTGSDRDIIKYSILGLVGSAISAFCGAGPGAIVGPALIFFGVHPQVSIATGMYTAVLTTGTSSILVFCFGLIKLDYAVLVALGTALGTIPGIYI